MKDTNKINQVVNQKTLAALNHLVRDDTGYVNEHGIRDEAVLERLLWD